MLKVFKIRLMQTFVYGDLYRYDVDKQEWKLISSPNTPPPLSAHQAVAWKAGRTIFIFLRIQQLKEMSPVKLKSCPSIVKPLIKKGGADLIAEVSNLTTKVSRAPAENKIVSEGPVLDPHVLKENAGILINKNEVNVVNPANENEETISEEDADEGETDSGVCEEDEDGSEEDTSNDDKDEEVTSDEVNLSDSVNAPCSEMDCVDSGHLGKEVGQMGMKVMDAHQVIDKMSQPNTGKSSLCEILPSPSAPGKDRVLPLEGKIGAQTRDTDYAQKASEMPNFTFWASLLTNRSAISTRLEQIDVGAFTDSGILEIE
ncbi:hypothetical protein U1Q18_020601, partial [Sarracenia purpurea var. burkii]